MGATPGDRRASTLVDLLINRAAETPDRPAYTYLPDAGETLTYGELYARAAGLAATVADVGAPGDRVLVASAFGPSFVSGFFGCLLAGRIPVPVADPGRGTGIADDCAAVAVLAPRAVGDLPWLDSTAPGAPIGEPVVPAAEDIALLQYTSGSTRAPRGVVVTHANLMHNLGAIASAFGTAADHHGVFWLPPHHDMGLVGGLLAPLHTGCPVTLMSPTGFLRDPLTWLRAIAASGRAVSGGPNLCYAHAVRKVAPADVASLDLSRWDVAFVGAEPVNPAVLDRFAEHFAPAGFRRESFLPCYGLAEATLLVTATRKGAGVRTEGGVVSCGVAADRIAVVGADGRRVAPGETGEIWVTGPSVARGYWRGGDAFGARLSGEPDTYLRTGDLGFERDGELYVTGRAKEVVIVRGRNIMPQDVEWSVEAGVPGVRACAAVGVTVAGEERLAVLVEARPRPDLDALVRQTVAREHGIDPHRVVVLRPGQLPRTTSGKLRRGEAAALAGAGEDLTGWLADRLGGPLDATTPLTDLGLDSVRAAELAAHVGGAVPAQRLLDGTTIADLTRSATPGVALSLFCHTRTTDVTHADVLDVARFADQHDFAALWLPDQRFPRYPGPFADPDALGAELADATTRPRIRVATGEGRAHDLSSGTAWVLCQGSEERFADAGADGANVLAALLLQDVDTIRAKLAAYRRAHPGTGHVTLLVRLPSQPARAADQIARLTAAGVDEIACLVDLGRPRAEVDAELARLATLTARPRPARPSVFAKARDFDLARRLSDEGLLPFYADLSGGDGATVEHDGRRVIMLGANDYLGLTADKRVRDAAAAAAMAGGTSVSGSRLLNGSTPAQRDLERTLARFVGRADALVFTTGYQANLGVLSAFMTEGTVLFADEECHASVYDGVAVGGGRVVRFRHNDPADLDRRLAADVAAALVMVDGVYSMSGDLAPLTELREVCDRHGVPLVVDDAHGLGMVGATGRGAEEELGAEGCADLLTGTFSKSLASVGGWVAGPRELLDWVRYNGRSMLFSTAISPPAVAAAAQALDVLAAEPERVARVRALAGRWRAGLSELGFDTGATRTAVVPVHIGDEMTCLRFASRLLHAGVYANCVLTPAVPPGRALIRTAVSAAHEPHHLETALSAFAEAGRALGIVSGSGWSPRRSRRDRRCSNGS